jgi:uncharacterized protein YndB with AHSA1/START domain
MKRVCLLLTIAVPVSAVAAVADASAAGFTVKTSLTIAAAPTEVYERFVHNIGDWWSPQHTVSGDSHNLSIEEKPMGCFCEKLPNGGVRHMQILYFDRGKVLRMSGLLGPLQGIGGSGVLTVNFTAARIVRTPADTLTVTKLDATYSVSGYSAAGMNAFAGPVDSVLSEQFNRLKNYVENGAAVPAKKQ